MPKPSNLTGIKFHCLTAIKIVGQDSFKRKIWLCKCDCGKKKEIRARHLVSGSVRTCGCNLGLERSKPALGLKREKHPKWKGGSFVRKQDGYIMEYVGGGKYKMQHRIIAERKYGTLKKDLVVHHKNEIKTDNRLCNLEILTNSEHVSMHLRERDYSNKSIVHVYKGKKYKSGNELIRKLKMSGFEFQRKLLKGEIAQLEKTQEKADVNG